jgi:hypothetical protein
MKPMHGALQILFMAALLHADSAAFGKLWYDGNAEIATYALQESRYGELREGTRVMVFVTEPMRLATHIKPDTKLPEDKMVRVIKLNDLRKFTTGIYEYSVMTSVFAAVEKKLGFENMATMKISYSSQEWCGQVFERLVRTAQKYEGMLYSYFESEGEESYGFDASGVETEDNLWIRVRELNGELLKEGESRKLRLIPSRWIIRKSHVPTVIVDATLSKGKPELRQSALGKIPTIPFSWKIGEGTTVVYVEQKYPHRIVEFKERDGSSGKLIAAQRQPYWQQNANRFAEKRIPLGLPKK